MNENTYWGYHLIVNAAACDKEAITNAETIRMFAKELVKRIEMVAYGEPQVIHFGEGNKAGFTLVQLIETSNICGHFCDDSGDIYLDVFSCKPYDMFVVISLIDEYFKPSRMQHTMIERQA